MTCSRNNPLPLLALLAIVAIAFAVLASAPAIPALRETAHSFNHAEAQEIKNCNTILSIWMNKSCERVNIIKRLDDGRIANEVIQPCRGGDAVLVTLYVFFTGTDYDAAVAILKAKGCNRVFP